MPELTDDERTVLMITAEGESLAAIGRWEQPIDHLVELGYLERGDKFNNIITPAGRIALGEQPDPMDNMARALIGIHNSRVSYRQQGEALAKQLVELTRSVAATTGDEIMVALQKCVSAIRDRAVELLNE